MLKYHVPASEICIGIPVRYFTITIRHPRLFQGVPLRISPLIIAGYVSLENENRFAWLSTKAMLEICGMGVVMNFIFTCTTIAALNSTSYIGIIFFAVAVLLYLLREWVCCLLPIVSFGMFAAVPLFLSEVSSLAVNGGKRSSVAIDGIFLQPEGFLNAVEMAGIFSFAMGILNLIPLFVFDGGRIVSTCLKSWKWVPKMVTRYYDIITGIIAFFAIIILTYDFLAGVIRLLWRNVVSD